MAGKNKQKIDTAVIAAAGSGTRLLPLTLHQPKAMVPVADRPLIHYIIDQVAVGGIKQFIVVINPDFQAVRKYIDYQVRRKEWRGIKFKIIEKRSKSFADSILAAEKFIHDRHFFAVACDDLLDDQPPPFLSLVKIFNRLHQPVAVLRQVTRKEISSYGGVSVTAVAKDLWRVRDIIEKPHAKEAPSNLGSMADYILPPDIFRYIRLAQKTLPKNKEVAVAHALKIYLQKRGKLLGWVFRGRHFDGGSKIGLAKASVYFGVKHRELGASFKKYLKSL